MKQSVLFNKTRKETPADADSINASYLIRSGFVSKNMAGVYALLPLGLKVVRNIENIVREEMNAAGGQEILMNVLQSKDLWDETGRWEEMKEIFYRVGDGKANETGLAPTHEEQVVDIVRKQVNSYKDLPLSLYQIQTKFRNEPRAKSGLLRGREFIMKDLYSFHTDQDDFESYYENMKKSYMNIFKRCGLTAKIVEATGGPFSKYSHEFQVLSPTGEDTVFYCEKCDFSQNKEISEVKEGDKCPKCGALIKKDMGIEVGNIFPLGVKFSSAMGAKFLDQEGKSKEIIMGCYGFGVTRALATVVEICYNATKNSMIWPKEIAPYSAHIISLNKDVEAEKIYDKLISDGVDVLYDDRNVSAGEKFAEADLIGCHCRIIVSEKSIEAGGYEVKIGREPAEVLPIEMAIKKIHEK